MAFLLQRAVTGPEANISHHEKRKIIFKSAMVGDMLVPRMIIFCVTLQNVFYTSQLPPESPSTCGPLKDPRSPTPSRSQHVAAEDALKWSRGKQMAKKKYTTWKGSMPSHSHVFVYPGPLQNRHLLGVALRHLLSPHPRSLIAPEK